MQDKRRKADKMPTPKIADPNYPLPIIDMASENDPLGSYTGVPLENAFEKPVQDADDL